MLVTLHETIRLGQMDKRYYALLKGELTDKEAHVRAPLYKFVAANGDRRVLVSETGQTAHSRFNIDQKLRGYTAVRVKIYTGRTHQIRVHSAHLGHPIVGDDKYGDFELNRTLTKQKFNRMFLHAHELRLKHPVTGEVLSLTADIRRNFTVSSTHIQHKRPQNKPSSSFSSTHIQKGTPFIFYSSEGSIFMKAFFSMLKYRFCSATYHIIPR